MILQYIKKRILHRSISLASVFTQTEQSQSVFNVVCLHSLGLLRRWRSELVDYPWVRRGRIPFHLEWHTENGYITNGLVVWSKRYGLFTFVPFDRVQSVSLHLESASQHGRTAPFHLGRHLHLQKFQSVRSIPQAASCWSKTKFKLENWMKVSSPIQFTGIQDRVYTNSGTDQMIKTIANYISEDTGERC